MTTSRVDTCDHEVPDAPPGTVTKCRLCRKSVRIPRPKTAAAPAGSPAKRCGQCEEAKARLVAAVEAGRKLKEERDAALKAHAALWEATPLVRRRLHPDLAP